MNFIETFNPAILLGDRLGLTLYGMFVEAYLKGNYSFEETLYRKFLKNFPSELLEHTPENFIRLIENIKHHGFDVFKPVYANPDEYSLVQGSHRCSIAIQLGLKDVPFNLRFYDDRTDDAVFHELFSLTEVDLIYCKRLEYIGRCENAVAFRCRLRAIMRQNAASFCAPFSSRTKIPTLRPYQGFEALGIAGKRPSQKRLDVYGLKRYLARSMNGLEIGCNVGFFSLLLAPCVNQLDAFDIEQNYIEVAKLTQEYCGIKNCHFYAQSLTGFHPELQYDFVVSTAVHGWSGLPFENYIALIDKCVRQGGLVLFESHEIDAEKDWPTKREVLLRDYELIESGLIDDVDKTMYASEMREFLLLRKK
jgi:SAM-dependent methyltransferase